MAADRLEHRRPLIAGRPARGQRLELRDALVQALTASWQADQKYTAWAQGVAQNGCSGHAPHDANYTGAQAASGSATTAKQQFVSLWNPVAQAYGLPARSENTV